MTIGELYAAIETELSRGPLTVRQIGPRISGVTVFDVLVAVRALRNAGRLRVAGSGLDARISLVEAPPDGSNAA